MDVKGKVLLQLFNKRKLKNGTKTYLEQNFFSIVKFNKLGFSAWGGGEAEEEREGGRDEKGGRAVGDGNVKWGKHSRREWVEGKRRVITLQSVQFFGMSQWKRNFPGEAHVRTQGG